MKAFFRNSSNTAINCMKKTILLPILLLFFYLTTANVLGQALFLEELNHSTWKSTARINDSTLKTVQEIQLAKVEQPKESLKQDVMLWSFRGDILTISEYDSALKKESIVSKCPYTIDFNKGVLSIILSDEETLNYKVGVTSTGTFGVLSRIKEKIKKK